MLELTAAMTAAALVAQDAGGAPATIGEWRDLQAEMTRDAAEAELESYFGDASGLETVLETPAPELVRNTLGELLRRNQGPITWLDRGGLIDVVEALQEMGEPPLRLTGSFIDGESACRLTIINHRGPVVARVEFHDDAGDLVAPHVQSVPFGGTVAMSLDDHLAPAAEIKEACKTAAGSGANRERNGPGLWLVEFIDADGHRATLTPTPWIGPLREVGNTLMDGVQLIRRSNEHQPRYFPPNAFASVDDRVFADPDSIMGALHPEELVAGDESLQQWYGQDFRRLDAPSLYDRRDEKRLEVYRLTLSPSFDWPRSVTVTPMKDGRARVVVRHAKKPRSHSPDGGEFHSHHRVLSQDEAETVIAWLASEDFWSAPSGRGQAGLDGCELVREGLRDGRYHVTARWTCDIGAPTDVAAHFCLKPQSGDMLFERYWPPRCARSRASPND